ncbi:kinase-like domain-containing protein [Hyaloraphidium curvatum]|nr:kinase-like domain-containing protein [Hyaloraphidium curvatum]
MADPAISTYRASSCTLCDEPPAASRACAACYDPPRADERFDGEVIYGAAEAWATGRVLGEGAFAKVRVARGMRTGRIAVVKSTVFAGKDTRSLLFSLREALALVHVAPHPAVPQLLDFVRTPAAAHLVMDIAPGEEVFTYVNNLPDGRMSEDEARRVIAQLLEALRHIHAQGVAHRDVKLDNIFWDPATGSLSLIDFGLAGFFDGRTLFDESVGCINYASPALLRLVNNRTPYLARSGHSDLWAAGVVAHGLLCGFFPFRHEEPDQMAREIWSRPAFDLEGVSKDGHDFLELVLNPSNEGKLTAEELLKHPWVAGLAPRSRDPAPKPIPRLPSGGSDVRRAAKAAEAALARLLPPYLASLDDGSASEADEHGEPSTPVEAVESFASVATLVAAEAPRPPQAALPVSTAKTVGSKSSLGKKLDVGRWFDKLRGKDRWQVGIQA